MCGHKTENRIPKDGEQQTGGRVRMRQSNRKKNTHRKKRKEINVVHISKRRRDQKPSTRKKVVYFHNLQYSLMCGARFSISIITASLLATKKHTFTLRISFMISSGLYSIHHHHRARISSARKLYLNAPPVPYIPHIERRTTATTKNDKRNFFR